MSTLLAFLSGGFLSTVATDVAKDVVKSAWHRVTAKSWEDLFVSAFVKAVNEQTPFLEKYSPEDCINFEADKFRRLLNSGLGIYVSGASLASIGSAPTVKQIATILSQNSVLFISGHTLSETDYESLLNGIIQNALAEFRQSVVENEQAFREAVLAEADENSDSHKAAMAFLRSISADLVKIDSNISELGQFVANGFIEQNSKIDELIALLKPTKSQEKQKGIVERIGEIVSEINNQSLPYRLEISTGTGEFRALDGAVAAQCRVTNLHTGEYVAVHFFERTPGSLTRNPPKLKLQFEFPNTPEGQFELNKWRDVLESGSDADIDIKYLKHMSTSLPDVFASSGQTVAGKLSIRHNPPESKVWCITIESVDKNDRRIAAIPIIKLKLERKGTVWVTYSNRFERNPFHFTLQLDYASEGLPGLIKFSHNIEGYSPRQLLKYAEWVDSLEAAEAIRIFDIETEAVILYIKPDELELSSAREMSEFVKSLCLIEDELGFEFIVPKASHITSDDLVLVESASHIIKNGSYSYELREIRFPIPYGEISKLKAIKNGEPCVFQVGPFVDSEKLFNKYRIDLGPYRVLLHSSALEGVDIEKMLNEAEKKSSRTAVLKNRSKRGFKLVRVYEKYQNSGHVNP